MLIFVSGHQPIHGTQILYFSDPVLAKRSAIPPPTVFVAIEEGEVNPQKAADRTSNVISKPEATDEPMSAMERAFIETLTGRLVQNAQSGHLRASHGFIEQLAVDREED